MAYLDRYLDDNKEEQWSWKGVRKNPSDLQKKRMIAKAMEVAVETVVFNHLYQFDGKVYKQVDGGPIGL